MTAARAFRNSLLIGMIAFALGFTLVSWIFF